MIHNRTVSSTRGQFRFKPKYQAETAVRQRLVFKELDDGGGMEPESRDRHLFWESDSCGWKQKASPGADVGTGGDGPVVWTGRRTGSEMGGESR